MDITTAWRNWVQAGENKEKRARRKVIVQTINAIRLSQGRWQIYDVAVQNLRFMGTIPERSPESIREAAVLCHSKDWQVKAIQASFK